MTAKRLEAEIALRGAEVRAGILEDRRRALFVKSPIDGVVADFQIRQLLTRRAVEAGQLLFHVMDTDAAWQLELKVKEKRMGHLLQAAKDNASTALPVQFIAVTNVERKSDAVLTQIATRAEIDPELGSVVEVLAVPCDQEDLKIGPDSAMSGEVRESKYPTRTIGAEVRARITCGRRCLGYVLFGDVVDFVQTYFWL